MRNPLVIDYNQANAVDARQEVDLRIGASFTRFQTMSFQDRYEGLDGVISYGNVIVCFRDDCLKKKKTKEEIGRD